MARQPNQNMRFSRPAKPSGLPPVAAREWDRIIADLEESNIPVTKAHGRLIGLAAMIVADMEDARETINTEGPYYENPKTGAMQLHPATRRLDSLGRDYVKLLSQLGLRSTAAAAPDNAGKTMEALLDE